MVLTHLFLPFTLPLALVIGVFEKLLHDQKHCFAHEPDEVFKAFFDLERGILQFRFDVLECEEVEIGIRKELGGGLLGEVFSNEGNVSGLQ